MEAALIIAILVLLFVVAPMVTFALVMRALARRNRVSPTVPTLAPLTWSFLPERPARLHRRLRRAIHMSRVASAGHVAAGHSGLGAIPELVTDLERRACVIDSELVVAARATGPARWSMLNELERQVYEIDALASRVAGLASAWAASAAAGGNGPAGLDAIGDRVSALETAMHEISAVSMNHPSWQPPQVPPQPIPYLRKVEGDKRD